MRSRQAPIPSGGSLDENILFEIAKNLLGQVIVDGRAWPCSNLQLSVGGFEEGPTGNRGIGGFLVRGDEAKALKRDSEDHASDYGGSRAEKRPKNEHGAIQRFLSRQETSHGDSDEDIPSTHSNLDDVGGSLIPPDVSGHAQQPEYHDDLVQSAGIDTYTCIDCQKILPAIQREEHQDWHFAKSLAAADKGDGSHQAGSASEGRPRDPTATKRLGASKISAGQGPRKVAKGQSRLAFG